MHVCVYRSERPWWQDAVVYQVYPRSFADHDGDGLGDIRGISDRLDYLADLGVDALWVSPFYPSPLHDGGYDVADYREVDPRLGTLEDLDLLIAGAHQRDMRFIMDIVPNHTSSEHPWFSEVLLSDPNSPSWDRYIIRQGRGPSHDQPPNNWRSVFHGPAWSPLTLADGTRTSYWYLHLFDASQPDLNWENDEVSKEFRDILHFWFDRGVDGFRIDVAHGLVKHPDLPDMDYAGLRENEPLGAGVEAPYWDQDGVHDVYREWRSIADAYEPPRMLCGETWAPSPERLALYQRADELHTSFNFDYLAAGWDEERMRASIDETIHQHATVGAPPTWVLSNHDVVRHATRLALTSDNPSRELSPEDRDVGLRRARAATVFMLGLPGTAYIYQGEELGLPEVFDIPDEARQDPMWFRSNGGNLGRDGCRIPLPWSADGPSCGFNVTGYTWLPQPSKWSSLARDAQEGDDASTLEMYRRALRLRRQEPALGDGPFDWMPNTPTQALSYRRSTAVPGYESVLVVINLGAEPVRLPHGWGTDVLLTSGSDVASLTEEQGACVVVGANTAVWLRA